MSAFAGIKANGTPPLHSLWTDFDSLKHKTWQVVETTTTLGRTVTLRQYGKKLVIRRDILRFFEEFRRVEVEELINI